MMCKQMASKRDEGGEYEWMYQACLEGIEGIEGESALRAHLKVG
jgi:hypothetical protein